MSNTDTGPSWVTTREQVNSNERLQCAMCRAMVTDVITVDGDAVAGVTGHGTVQCCPACANTVQ